MKEAFNRHELKWIVRNQEPSNFTASFATIGVAVIFTYIFYFLLLLLHLFLKHVPDGMGIVVLEKITFVISFEKSYNMPLNKVVFQISLLVVDLL